MAKEEEKKEKKATTTIGIDILDRLSPQGRREVKARAKQHWDSLSQAEKVEHMNLLYDMVREKMVQRGGMISQADAIKEFLNVDFPRSQEAAAQEMERAGYVDVARSIRQTRWGVDKFAIEIIDDENRERGVMLEE